MLVFAILCFVFLPLSPSRHPQQHNVCFDHCCVDQSLTIRAESIILCGIALTAASRWRYAFVRLKYADETTGTLLQNLLLPVLYESWVSSNYRIKIRSDIKAIFRKTGEFARQDGLHHVRVTDVQAGRSETVHPEVRFIRILPVNRCPKLESTPLILFNYVIMSLYVVRLNTRS